MCLHFNLKATSIMCLLKIRFMNMQGFCTHLAHNAFALPSAYNLLVWGAEIHLLVLCETKFLKEKHFSHIINCSTSVIESSWYPKTGANQAFLPKFLTKINNHNNNNRRKRTVAGGVDHMYMCTSYSKLDVSPEIKVNGIGLVILSLKSPCSLWCWPSRWDSWLRFTVIFFRLDDVIRHFNFYSFCV